MAEDRFLGGGTGRRSAMSLSYSSESSVEAWRLDRRANFAGPSSVLPLVSTLGGGGGAVWSVHCVLGDVLAAGPHGHDDAHGHDVHNLAVTALTLRDVTAVDLGPLAYDGLINDGPLPRGPPSNPAKRWYVWPDLPPPPPPTNITVFPGVTPGDAEADMLTASAPGYPRKTNFFPHYIHPNYVVHRCYGAMVTAVVLDAAILPVAHGRAGTIVGRADRLSSLADGRAPLPLPPLTPAQRKHLADGRVCMRGSRTAPLTSFHSGTPAYETATPGFDVRCTRHTVHGPDVYYKAAIQTWPGNWTTTGHEHGPGNWTGTSTETARLHGGQHAYGTSPTPTETASFVIRGVEDSLIVQYARGYSARWVGGSATVVAVYHPAIEALSASASTWASGGKATASIPEERIGGASDYGHGTGTHSVPVGFHSAWATAAAPSAADAVVLPVRHGTTHGDVGARGAEVRGVSHGGHGMGRGDHVGQTPLRLPPTSTWNKCPGHAPDTAIAIGNFTAPSEAPPHGPTPCDVATIGTLLATDPARVVVAHLGVLDATNIINATTLHVASFDRPLGIPRGSVVCMFVQTSTTFKVTAVRGC